MTLSSNFHKLLEDSMSKEEIDSLVSKLDASDKNDNSNDDVKGKPKQGTPADNSHILDPDDDSVDKEKPERADDGITQVDTDYEEPHDEEHTHHENNSHPGIKNMEESENLNELSKDTYGNYIRKSAHSLADLHRNDHESNRQMQQLAYLYHNGDDDTREIIGGPKAVSHRHKEGENTLRRKLADKHRKLQNKIGNRHQGIATAVKKISENMEESENLFEDSDNWSGIKPLHFPPENVIKTNHPNKPHIWSGSGNSHGRFNKNINSMEKEFRKQLHAHYGPQIYSHSPNTGYDPKSPVNHFEHNFYDKHHRHIGSLHSVRNHNLGKNHEIRSAYIHDPKHFPKLAKNESEELQQMEEETINEINETVLTYTGEILENLELRLAANETAEFKVSVEGSKKLFESAEIPAEEVEKLNTLFEAAVNEAAEAHYNARIQQYEEALVESIEEFVESTAEDIEESLNEAINEWKDENQLAIESGTRARLVDSFMSGLRDLFEEHYIDVPESRIDVVEELMEEVESLSDTIEQQQEINESLYDAVCDYQKATILEAETKGLVATDAVRIKKLSESIEFVNEESFVKKVKIVKDAVVNKKTISEDVLSDNNTMLNESEKDVPTNSLMQSYLNV